MCYCVESTYFLKYSSLQKNILYKMIGKRFLTLVFPWPPNITSQFSYLKYFKNSKRIWFHIYNREPPTDAWKTLEKIFSRPNVFNLKIIWLLHCRMLLPNCWILIPNFRSTIFYSRNLIPNSLTSLKTWRMTMIFCFKN